MCVYVCFGWSGMIEDGLEETTTQHLENHGVDEAEDDQEHVKTLLTSRALRLCSSAQGTGRSWCLCLWMHLAIGDKRCQMCVIPILNPGF